MSNAIKKWTEKCRAVRAFVWTKLKDIIAYAREMTKIVHSQSGHSTRYSFLEAILFSAYWIVFHDRIPSEKEAAEDLGRRYNEHAPEQVQDEAETMMERLMNEPVMIVGDTRDRATLGRILYVIANEEQRNTDQSYVHKTELVDRYKKTADLHGLYVLPRTGELAIYLRWPFISKIFGGARDYHKLLSRHHAAVASENNYGKPVKPAFGQGHRAILFKSEIIETEPPF